MLAAGYDEDEIVMVCDGFASSAINAIVSRLQLHDIPWVGDVERLFGFVMGYRDEDLLLLGFAVRGGGDFTAVVPLEFIWATPNLRLGKEMIEEYNAQTPRSQMEIACQLYQGFDYVFTYSRQRELWTRFVLPQTLTVRYPRESVVFRPTEIERFGLS